MTEDLNDILEIGGKPAVSALGEQKPPSRIVNIVCECLGGVLGGLIGAWLGFFVGLQVAYWAGAHDEGDYGFLILGVTGGYALISPIGVYLGGRLRGQSGSFWATWAGGLLGCGLAYLWVSVGPHLPPTRLLPGDTFWLVALVILVAGPVVCSLIAFNLTRRCKARSRWRG